MNLRVLPSVLIAAACLAQNSDVRTRQLWDTSLLSKRPAASSAPKQPAPAKPVRGLVGITLWELRPARATDRREIRALIHDGGKDTEWTPQRISADAALQEGQHIRIAVESGDEGYLYIVDRDLYADGSKSDPYLIFPTLRTRGGDNHVKAGVVIQIPAAEDDPIYFKVQRSRPDQVQELLSIFVSPKPIASVQLTDGRQSLPQDQVSAWEKRAQSKTSRLEAVGQAGNALTVAEKDASLGKSLTQADPVPQTMYHVESKPGDTIMLQLPLKIAPAPTQ
jgi:hypothetical protein